MKKITMSQTIKEILEPIGISAIISQELDFLDVGKDATTISFISESRLKRIEDKGLNPWKDLRTEMKLGKFLMKHYGYKEEAVENIVNRYRMFYNFSFNGGDNIFEIVNGMDIAHWYDYKTYKTGGGSLNSSCMRFQSPERFLLYTGNPDKIKLVILKEDNKLIGRALLWISDDGSLYLDRPYTRYDDDILLYKLYAEKKNIYNYYSISKIPTNFQVTVKLETVVNIPYLDSMHLQNGNVFRTNNIVHINQTNEQHIDF